MISSQKSVIQALIVGLFSLLLAACGGSSSGSSTDSNSDNDQVSDNPSKTEDDDGGSSDNPDSDPNPTPDPDSDNETIGSSIEFESTPTILNDDLIQDAAEYASSDVGPNGDVVVTWVENTFVPISNDGLTYNNYSTFARLFDHESGRWSEPRQLDDGVFPQVGLGWANIADSVIDTEFVGDQIVTTWIENNTLIGSFHDGNDWIANPFVISGKDGVGSPVVSQSLIEKPDGSGVIVVFETREEDSTLKTLGWSEFSFQTRRWSDAEVIFGPTQSLFPQRSTKEYPMVSDPKSGKIHLAWLGGASDELRTSSFVGGDWSPIEIVIDEDLSGTIQGFTMQPDPESDTPIFMVNALGYESIDAPLTVRKVSNAWVAQPIDSLTNVAGPVIGGIVNFSHSATLSDGDIVASFYYSPADTEEIVLSTARYDSASKTWGPESVVERTGPNPERSSSYYSEKLVADGKGRAALVYRAVEDYIETGRLQVLNTSGEWLSTGSSFTSQIGGSRNPSFDIAVNESGQAVLSWIGLELDFGNQPLKVLLGQ